MDEELLKKLASANPDERCQALSPCAQDTTPDSLACLIEALRDPVEKIRRKARILLKRVTGRDYAFNRDEWLRWWKENATLKCQACSRALFDRRLYYRVKATVTSEPREIVLTEEDLLVDHKAEIQKLCDEMSRRDPQEIQDEVFVMLEYFLCVTCKKKYVTEIRKTE